MPGSPLSDFSGLVCAASSFLYRQGNLSARPVYASSTEGHAASRLAAGDSAVPIRVGAPRSLRRVRRDPLKPRIAPTLHVHISSMRTPGIRLGSEIRHRKGSSAVSDGNRTILVLPGKGGCDRGDLHSPCPDDGGHETLGTG